jgi:uncharacterized protein (TIGR02271 family)
MLAMTTQAEVLLGAHVTGADGKVMGTVEQVFSDDADGVPAWARVRAGKTSRFVPLTGSQASSDGLNVPFDAQMIMDGPSIEAGEHMSAAQIAELTAYFTAAVPAQAPERGKQAAEEWLVRREERLAVGKEMSESGHVRLHRYVDVEPAEKTIHLFHEEYAVERSPIGADERIRGNIEEAEQEITLHAEHGIMSKETVPVERMRLVTKRVEEDQTFRDDIRRERIEIEPESSGTGQAQGHARTKPRG